MSASFGVFVTSNLRECHYKLQATYMHACMLLNPLCLYWFSQPYFHYLFPFSFPSPPLPSPPLLDPVNLNVAANTNEGSVSFSWETETGPEPITNYMVLMGEVQFVISNNRPMATASYRDLLQDLQIRRVKFTVTSVIARTHWPSETSAGRCYTYVYGMCNHIRMCTYVHVQR